MILRRIPRLISLLVLCLVVCHLAAEEAAPLRLFDGQTLRGWQGNEQVWRVEDGAITAEIPAGAPLQRNEFLFWEGEVNDFELTLEFRLTGHPSANSGIQIRSQRLPDGDAAGLQADLDTGATWLGRIYDEHGRGLLVERGTRVSIAPDGRRWVDTWADPAAFADVLRPDGWNTYRITARASNVELWVNGRRMAALDDHQVDAAEFGGKLALQLHSGEGPVRLQFRNLVLRPLGRTEPPARAATQAPPPLPPSDTLVEGEAGDRRWHASPVLWHLQPNPAPAAGSASADANRVVNNLKLPLGFQAELIAAEPAVRQPIAFTFDARGRLWIAEAYGYPVRQPEGEGKDRIIILADADGDGAFEQRTVFTEGLNLVSGIEVGFGGVWVGAAPELLFIPDRDGDDRPDGPPEVLLDGWGYQDTHETLNSFTWGPDGWLYGNQGVFVHSRVGRPGTPAADRQAMRAAVWRYHPVRHEFEVFAHGGSNQWGIDFNSAGHLFITHCRSFFGGGGTSYVVRNGYYWNQTNSDYPSFISNRAPDFAPQMNNPLRASARYDSGEGGAGKPGTTAVYGGHSHVGTMIYLADNWPEIYRDHLFTHNLHGRQLNHQHNVRTGAGYETFHAGYDLLFAPDFAYLPVDLDYGPDGAVYVIDWVDEQHCHHPLPEVWDRSNGRVYRISWSDTYRPRTVDLTAMTDLQLVDLHTHRNEWYVRTARRLLQERAARATVEPAALERLRTHWQESAHSVQRLRSIWTLHVTAGLSDAELVRALQDPAEEVRAWAVALGTERPSALALPAATLARLAADDPSPMVRLAVASTLPLVPAEDCWRIATALATRAEDAEDRWLPRLTWFGLARVIREDVPRAMAFAEASRVPALADWTRWYLAGRADGREAWVQRLQVAPEADAAREVQLLSFALDTVGEAERPAGWAQVAARLAPHADPAVRNAVDQLSAIFGDTAVRARVRAALADPAAPIEARLAAFDLLQRVNDTAAVPVYLEVLTEPALRSAVLPVLARAEHPGVAPTLLRLLPALEGQDRAVALTALTSRAPYARALLAAVEDGSLERRWINALHIRQMRNLRDETINGMLDRSWGAVGESSRDAQATIARLQKTYAEAPHWAYDARRGRDLYQQLCATCHVLDGNGGNLGPELNGSWRNGVEYFLENIVDPNAVVGIDYQLNVLTLRDGTVVSGMVERATDDTLMIRTMTETVRVPRGQIVEQQVMEQSLMPPGLLEGLSEREFIELMKYLTGRREEP